MVIMNSQAEQKKLQSIIVISSSSASSLVWLSEVDEELSVPDLSLLPDPGGVPGHGDDEGLGLLGQPAHGASCRIPPDKCTTFHLLLPSSGT